MTANCWCHTFHFWMLKSVFLLSKLIKVRTCLMYFIIATFQCTILFSWYFGLEDRSLITKCNLTTWSLEVLLSNAPWSTWSLDLPWKLRTWKVINLNGGNNFQISTLLCTNLVSFCIISDYIFWPAKKGQNLVKLYYTYHQQFFLYEHIASSCVSRD